MAQKIPRLPASVLRKRDSIVAKARPVPESEVGLYSGSSRPCSSPESGSAATPESGTLSA